LLTTAIYVIDLNLFTAWWISIINIVIPLSLNNFIIKKRIKRRFTFKEAFTTYFISAIGLVLSVSFNMILFNVVDPGAQDTIKEITIKYADYARWKFNH
jgi:hypothetical protein